MGENDLKEQCEKAEEIYLRAKRRAGWLERRMYDAPTEELFTMLSAELEKQEKLVNTLPLLPCLQDTNTLRQREVSCEET